MGPDHAAGSDYSSILDANECADFYVVGDLAVRVDNGGRMDFHGRDIAGSIRGRKEQDELNFGRDGPDGLNEPVWTGCGSSEQSGFLEAEVRGGRTVGGTDDDVIQQVDLQEAGGFLKAAGQSAIRLAGGGIS